MPKKKQKNDSHLHLVNIKGIPLPITNKEGRILNLTTSRPESSKIWKNPYVIKFFKTADPKWLKLAIEKEPDLIKDPSWAEILASHKSLLKYYKTLTRLSPEQERGKSYMLKIDKAIRALIQGRGRPRKVYSEDEKEKIRKKLDDFIEDGLKHIKILSRYPDHPYSSERRRYNDLLQYVDDNSKQFNNTITPEKLKNFNQIFKHRKPLLKAVFGYLEGLIEDKDIQPKSVIRSLDRILKH